MAMISPSTYFPEDSKQKNRSVNGETTARQKGKTCDGNVYFYQAVHVNYVPDAFCLSPSPIQVRFGSAVDYKSILSWSLRR